MVESLGNEPLAAYLRVERIMRENALDIKLLPQEAEKQVRVLLEPVTPKDTPQGQPPK